MSTVRERSKADVGKFFSPGTWGQVARYTPTGGSMRKINGDFVAAFKSISPENVDVVSSDPAFLCATVDVPDASEERDAVLAVTDGTFYLTRAEVNGDVTVLFLSKSAPE